MFVTARARLNEYSLFSLLLPWWGRTAGKPDGQTRIAMVTVRVSVRVQGNSGGAVKTRPYTPSSLFLYSGAASNPAAALEQRPVRLKFYLTNARLYSYRCG